MKYLNNQKIIILLLFLLNLFISSRSLSTHGLEFRDDEIFYFQSSKEMLLDGNVMSPTYFGENRFQKPILFYWLVILFFKIFGINWWAARIIAVIFGSLTVCTAFLIAREFLGKKAALLSAFILMAVPLFFRHAKNVVPDMALTFFIVFSIYCLIKFIKTKNSVYDALFFISCALGFMLKGYTAIIIPFITALVYFVVAREWEAIKRINFLRGLAILLIIILPWFIYMYFKHGAGYFNYVIETETKSRVIANTNENMISFWIKMFLSHLLFYFKTILNYFAPWSLIFFIAMPNLVSKKTYVKEDKLYLILPIWMFSAVLFFSSIFSVINHYMLAIAVPFAILLADYLIKTIENKKVWTRVINIYFMFLITLVSLAFMFIAVFLAGQHKWWLLIFLVLYGVIIYLFSRKKDVYIKAFALSAVMIFCLSQSDILNKAGLTSHPVLSKMAKTINMDQDPEYFIGVGSHDIHEKELQVYIDKEIQKAGTSFDSGTKHYLSILLNTDKKVYCLILEKDFDKFIKPVYSGKIRVLQEDYILRRRMYLDKGFISAIIRLDQEKVKNYLKEKIILFEKIKNA